MTDLAGQNKTFFFNSPGVVADANAPYTNSGVAAQLTLDELNAAGVVTEAAGAIVEGPGALSLTLDGTGDFLFQGANTFTGNANIGGQARVSLAADDALGAGQISFQSGAVGAALESAAMNIALTQTVLVEPGVSATLEAASGDTLTLNGALEAMGGQGTTLHIGSTTDTGAVVLAGGGSEVPEGALSVDGGTLRIGSAGSASLLSTLTGGVTVNGTLDLDGESLTLDNLSGAGAIVNSGAAATLTLIPSFNTFSGAISGNLSVDVSSPGTVFLTGADTYTGGTTIALGSELDIGDGATPGSLAGPVVDNGALRFYESGAHTIGNTLSGSGQLDLNNGPPTLTSHFTLTGDASQFTGSATLNSAVLTVDSAGAFSKSNTMALDDDATLETTTNLTLSWVAIGASYNDAGTLEAAAGTTLSATIGAFWYITLHVGSLTDTGLVVLGGRNLRGTGDEDFMNGGVVEIDGGTLDVLSSLQLPSVVFKGTAGKLILNDNTASVSSAAGSSGEVDLNNSQINFSGGGETVRFVSGADDQATLTGAGSAWDTVYGSGGRIVLNGAQASVVGGGDVVDWQGSASNTVSLYNTGGVWDTVYVNRVYLTNAQASVINPSANVNLLGAHDAVSLYYSGSGWDNVYGSNGVIGLYASQAAIVGGGDTVYFLIGGATSDAASLYNTGGAWDTVYGSNGVVALTNAQASVVGSGDAVYLLGSAKDSVSLYNANTLDAVYGSHGLVILTNAQANVTGGGDTIDFNGSSGNLAALYNTSGTQDTVNAVNGAMVLNSAQAAIVGYGDTIFMTGASTASETLTNSAFGDTYSYQPNMGVSTINGFTTHDAMQLSKSDFTSVQDLFNHMSQAGDDTVIKLDASDQITLTNVQKMNLAQSQFSLV